VLQIPVGRPEFENMFARIFLILINGNPKIQKHDTPLCNLGVLKYRLIK
jgi:hypothetical protein